MTKVIVNGGLGNQLFQLSYCINLYRLSGQNVQIAPENEQTGSRIFEISELIKEFPFLSLTTLDPWVRKRIALSEKFISNRLISEGISRKINPVYNFESPNATFVNRNSKKILFGYFQDFKMVDEIWEILSPSLVKILNTYSSHVQLSGRPLLHIRGGDLWRHKDTIGILGIDYYKLAIRKLNVSASDAICVTDDVCYASRLCGELGVETILGPDDLEAWETLALISKSDSVITANSTLSWWGSYIAQKNSAQVVIPNPWFKNLNEGSENFFQTPGMHLSEANFLN